MLSLFGLAGYFLFTSIRTFPERPNETTEPAAAASFIPESVSTDFLEFLAFKDASILFLPDPKSSGVPLSATSLPYAPGATPHPPITSTPDTWTSSAVITWEGNRSVHYELIRQSMAKPKATGFGSNPEYTAELLPVPADPMILAFIFEHGSTQPVASISLPEEFQQQFGAALWGTAEYAFFVTSGIPAGPPAPTRSSGNARVDEGLQKHFSLSGSIPPLPDGYYLLRVEP